jgi:large subunit ribosomal protein L23
MSNLYEVLRRPLVTEKSVRQSGMRQYGFVVDKRASKTQIKEAVETLFNVNVTGVNTMNVAAKRGMRGGRRSRKVVIRNPQYKKAFVTLAEGQMIDVFEGVK